MSATQNTRRTTTTMPRIGEPFLGLSPEQIDAKLKEFDEQKKQLETVREGIKNNSRRKGEEMLDKANELEARVKHYRDKDDIDSTLSQVSLLRREAHALLGNVPEKEEDGGLLNRLGKRLPFIQVALLALLVFGTIGGFYAYEAKINAYNESLSETEVITKKINAFNDANLQRVVFERFLQATDLVLIFLFILIVAPTVLGYVLPFVKTKKNFSTEFYESLTPWERTKLFGLLFCALLVYFGLSHTVNQF